MKCYWCDKEIKKGELEEDHYFPRKFWNMSNDWIYVNSCASCNGHKNKFVWIKNKDGTIDKYDERPVCFVSFEEDYDFKKVALTTVFTIRKGKLKPNKDLRHFVKYGESIEDYMVNRIHKKKLVNEDYKF